MKNNIKKICIGLLVLFTIISIYYYLYNKNNIDLNNKNDIIKNTWIKKWEKIDYKVIGALKKEDIQLIWKVEIEFLKNRDNLNNLR